MGTLLFDNLTVAQLGRIFVTSFESPSILLWSIRLFIGHCPQPKNAVHILARYFFTFSKLFLLAKILK